MTINYPDSQHELNLEDIPTLLSVISQRLGMIFGSIDPPDFFVRKYGAIGRAAPYERYAPRGFGNNADMDET
ncbi:hypothetical protein [Methylogaea oryzae]|uniref:Uncharacterized protein n=1 Tax=Methylogaea oryzae TaxID=1295382 RepID=A0A8D5AI09_9GAMM|nr:hypothetical protein [Methylogaea oryzae]BBL70841.1 hypothetical protein MoryE10_14470 [Methylogaea oryzae]